PPSGGPELTDRCSVDRYVNCRRLPEIVPYAPCSVIATVPVPGGATAVIVCSSTTSKLWAGVAPNLTPVVPCRASPVIVTVVPPLDGPVRGNTAVRSGHSMLASNCAVPCVG